MNFDIALAISIVGLAGACYLAALVYAVMQIVRSPQLESTGRLLWVAALICLPLVATVAWFLAGPRPFDAALSLSRR
ncbi:PLDc N-terminal domain-containing protein [Mycetocola zhadangensis]|uniref:PLDc N-terminal domain-containing protein n=1 Tax=Mycetocola zhadangensis TaxID=1164595 RepID=UPI003A4DF71E